jgi:hypothetical protein
LRAAAYYFDRNGRWGHGIRFPRGGQVGRIIHPRSIQKTGQTVQVGVMRCAVVRLSQY